MNAQSKIIPPKSKPARPARAKIAPPLKVPPREAAPAAPALPLIPETAIELVEFVRLRRASENVRHVRADEDIQPLADDIAAHGLLQSMIGYRAEDIETGAGPDTVWIVGGGRRLQALAILADAERINAFYKVPVLIRPRSEAIELSLSENLAKRDMSPVDECHAFTELMKPGTTSPADLAKRFGFTQRYVEQRLRLAQLAPEILDALAERKIAINAAMSYARSSDQGLQREVFKGQEKSNWDKHAPARIQAAYSAVQLTDKAPLYVFAGADAYEAAGGAYEDDLFAEEGVYSRKLANPGILYDVAQKKVVRDGGHVFANLIAEYPMAATFSIPDDLRLAGKVKPGPGMVLVQSDWQLQREELWKNARKVNAELIAIIGIDQTGALAWRKDAFLVPKEIAAAIKPSAPKSSSGYSTPPRSAEEVEAARREREVATIAWRLGVGPFDGTPLDGLAFWPTSAWVAPVETGSAAQFPDGRLVCLQVYVTQAQFEAQIAEAERRYDAQRAQAEKAEAAKLDRIDRHAEIVADILAQDPEPAVVVIDDDVFFRQADGRWAEFEDAAKAEEADNFLQDLHELLAECFAAGDAISTYDSAAEFRAAASVKIEEMA